MKKTNIIVIKCIRSYSQSVITAVLPLTISYYIFGNSEGDLILTYLPNKISYIYNNAHLDKITYLNSSFFNQMFLSCSNDKTVKIWKMHYNGDKEWFTLISSYFCKSTPQLGLFTEDDYIVCLTKKRYMKVFNMYSLQSIKKFKRSELN